MEAFGEMVRILNQKNGESIYGCGQAYLPKPEWGRYTQKGNLLYAQYPDDTFISFARPEHSSYPLPDQRATVVELELL